MTKAKKRVARKTRKVATLRQAIRAYGGVRKMAKAFDTTPEFIRQCQRWGEIPCTDHLGLMMGLKRRGYEPSPKLFGLKKSLDELAGM